VLLLLLLWYACSNDPGAAAGNRGFVAKVADFGLARTLNHTSKVVTKTYGELPSWPDQQQQAHACIAAAAAAAAAAAVAVTVTVMTGAW